MSQRSIVIALVSVAAVILPLSLLSIETATADMPAPNRAGGSALEQCSGDGQFPLHCADTDNPANVHLSRLYKSAARGGGDDDDDDDDDDGGTLPDPDEPENSSGTLQLLDEVEREFNPMLRQLTFGLIGSEFSADLDDYVVEINGQDIDLGGLTITPGMLSIEVTLQNGRNDATLWAADSNGLLLISDSTLWAGNQTLSVTVLNEDGTPAEGASVRVTLADDATVSAEDTTAAGTVLFENIPMRTLFVSAETADNRFVAAATVGDGTPLLMMLVPINAPSAIDNNDFSLGLIGWEVGTAPVATVPHQEAPTAIAGEPDFDLQLSTAGEGPQSISRTFVTSAGTKSVNVRYRFITSEIPGGYFGSEYNDFFAVSLRSQGGGGLVSAQNSMNGLGLGAFDGAGATAWREVQLPVSQEGDVVQVDVTVANVGDGLFGSQVLIDAVEEKGLAVTQVSLLDIDNSALGFLSLGTHPYFGGNTRVHGTITVEGPEDAELANLTLEVVGGGAVIATGTLAAAARTTLLQAFGADERVQISTAQLLFEIAGTGAGPGADGDVRLRVRAESSDGQTATEEAGAARVLSRYTGAVRYGERDASQGGDDWAVPSASAFIGGLGVTVGDISNMNGGAFPPHGSHRNGQDFDGWFAGYNQRNAATAQTMIGLLNRADGSRIDRVLVTFQQAPTDPFWTAIQNVTLADGRLATNVIRRFGGHTTHFHMRVSPP